MGLMKWLGRKRLAEDIGGLYNKKGVGYISAAEGWFRMGEKMQEYQAMANKVHGSRMGNLALYGAVGGTMGAVGYGIGKKKYDSPYLGAAMGFGAGLTAVTANRLFCNKAINPLVDAMTNRAIKLGEKAEKFALV